MSWNFQAQEPYKGYCCRPWLVRGSGSGQARADRYSGARLAHCSQAGHQACERRSRGQPRSRLSLVGPKRAKPRGASSRRWVNRPSPCQGLLEGQKPRSRGLPGRPTASAVGETGGETACGCIRAETRRRPSARRKLRRVNPMSAAGVKQSRPGLDGSKPPRG
jgi:hypothetical protein